jgi:tetratricopeptide (TPR) repeat protein
MLLHWFKTHGPVVLCLLVIYAAGAGYRIGLFKQLPNYHPGSDVGFFWTENALQYHYAQEIAEGRAPPRIDPLFEHPHGLDTRRDLTMMMEHLHGGLYRLFGGDRPFHVFLIACICLSTMLVVFPVYGMARELTGHPWAAVYAAALYTVSMPGFARILGSYGREHFTLPLVFAGLWALMRSMRSDRHARTFALAAGLFFSLSLASWHFARFAVGLMLVLYLLVLLLPAKAGPAASQAEAKPSRRGLLFLFLPILLVFLVDPALRHRLLNPGGDTHVWSLFWSKLIHFGQKPAMPSELPFETRFLWVEAFNRPDLNTWIYGYGLIPLLALVGAFCILRHRPLHRPAILFLLLGGVFLSLFLLVQRMHGFLIVFLCVLSAALLADFGARRRLGTLCFYLAFAGLAFQAHTFYHYGQPQPFKQWVDRTFPPVADERVPDWHFNTLTLVDWLKAFTREDDGILSSYSLGPVIAAYAHRPVVLHSKAENPDLRHRIRTYYEALFSSEEAFASFCRSNEVSYVVTDAQTVLMLGPDSDRYLVDQLALRVDSAAYRMQFRPASLAHFVPVFQNPRYRVYAFREAVSGDPYEPSYQCLFDAGAFGEQVGDTFIEDRREQVFKRLRRAVRLQRQGEAYMRQQQLSRAMPLLNEALELNAGLPGLASTVAQLHFLDGNRAYALQLIDRALKEYPALVLPYEIKARMLGDLGRFGEARAVVEAGLQVRPDAVALQRLSEQLNRPPRGPPDR